MAEDNAQQVVQPGAVPSGETVSPPVVIPPAPSPEELLKQEVARVADRATKAEAEIEKFRREVQSVKDRANADVLTAQRRARNAESTSGAIRQHFQTLDPDVAKEMELAELRAREQERVVLEQEEQTAQYQANVVRGFQERMSQFITGLGLAPTDPKIDWATDAPDLLTRMGRIQDSVAKIQKETIQTTQSGWEKRLKDLEDKVKQANIEANSVNTAASTGAAAGSDAEFVRQFASGELPFNKANKERYEKIRESY